MESIDDSSFYYNYKSPIGVFIIQFDNNVSKWALVLNGIIYGHYLSPIAAADDVYCQSTGAYEWDSISALNLSIPTDIYEWEKYRHT
jgi:hypothetical protein